MHNTNYLIVSAKQLKLNGIEITSVNPVPFLDYYKRQGFMDHEYFIVYVMPLSSPDGVDTYITIVPINLVTYIISTWL